MLSRAQLSSEVLSYEVVYFVFSAEPAIAGAASAPKMRKLGLVVETPLRPRPPSPPLLIPSYSRKNPPQSVSVFDRSQG